MISWETEMGGYGKNLSTKKESNDNKLSKLKDMGVLVFKGG